MDHATGLFFYAPNPLEYALIDAIAFDKEGTVVGNREKCSVGIATSNPCPTMRIPGNIKAQPVRVFDALKRHPACDCRAWNKIFLAREEVAEVAGHSDAVRKR